MSDSDTKSFFLQAPLDWLESFEAAYSKLMSLESKLGTPEEGAHDFEEARKAAHDINNLLTTMILRMQLDGQPTPSKMRSIPLEIDRLYQKLADGLSRCTCEIPSEQCPMVHMPEVGDEDRLIWVKRLSLSEVRAILDYHTKCVHRRYLLKQTGKIDS